MIVRLALILSATWLSSPKPAGSDPGLDNTVHSYDDTAVMVDPVLPAPPDELSAELTTYLGTRATTSTLRFPDGHTTYAAEGVLRVQPRSAAGLNEFQRKYGITLVSAGAPADSGEVVVADSAGRTSVSAFQTQALVARPDLSRADLNQVAYWLHQLGIHGTVSARSPTALQLLALWAQISVEDTRKVAISMLGVPASATTDVAKRVQGIGNIDARFYCPCMRAGGDTIAGQPTDIFDALIPPMPSCQGDYSRKAKQLPSEDKTLSCAQSQVGDREDVLLLHRLVVRRSGGRSDFLDRKRVLFWDLEGDSENIHITVIPGSLLDSEEKRDHFLKELSYLNQYDEATGRADGKSCSEPFRTEKRCSHDTSNVGYLDWGLDTESDGSVVAKCEFEYDYDPNRPRDITYRGFILHKWAPDETGVGILVWEGDECKTILGREICNPDDFLVLYYVPKAATLNAPSGLSLPQNLDAETVSLQVLTVRNCDCPQLEGPPQAQFQRLNGMERCDGRDQDCNGLIDDNPRDVGMQCGEDLGICTPGTLQCLPCDPHDPSCPSGVKPTCVGGRGPAGHTEICGDHIDNDCDGSIDEGPMCLAADSSFCPGSAQVCGSNVGTCRTGSQLCTMAGWAMCSGVGPDPAAEQRNGCNGLDEDCNGAADDYLACGCVDGASRGCGYNNVGACRMGTQTCHAGVWTACAGAVLPRDEVCDGVDNDCNGRVDENLGTRSCWLQCGGGESRKGIQLCTSGRWERQCQVSIAADICNHMDDDCDGAVDNFPPGDPRATCGIGECQNRIGTVCDTCAPRTPPMLHEIYGDPSCHDGKDNDCDGKTDDDDDDCWTLRGGGG